MVDTIYYQDEPVQIDRMVNDIKWLRGELYSMVQRVNSDPKLKPVDTAKLDSELAQYKETGFVADMNHARVLRNYLHALSTKHQDITLYFKSNRIIYDNLLALHSRGLVSESSVVRFKKYVK